MLFVYFYLLLNYLIFLVWLWTGYEHFLFHLPHSRTHARTTVWWINYSVFVGISAARHLHAIILLHLRSNCEQKFVSRLKFRAYAFDQMDYCRFCHSTGLACRLIAANIVGFGSLLFLLHCRVRAGSNVRMLYQLLNLFLVFLVAIVVTLATCCDVTQRMAVAPKSQRHFFSLTYQCDSATSHCICFHIYIHTHKLNMHTYLVISS